MCMPGELSGLGGQSGLGAYVVFGYDVMRTISRCDMLIQWVYYYVNLAAARLLGCHFLLVLWSGVWN